MTSIPKIQVNQVNKMELLEEPKHPSSLNKSNVHSLNYSKTTFTLTATHTTSDKPERKSGDSNDKNKIKIENFPEEINEELFASMITPKVGKETKKLTQSIEPQKEIFKLENPMMTPTTHLKPNKMKLEEIKSGFSFGQIVDEIEKISEKPYSEEDDIPKSINVESDIVDPDEFEMEVEAERFMTESDGIDFVKENDGQLRLNKTISEKYINVENY